MIRIILTITGLFLSACFNVNPIVTGGGSQDATLFRKRVFTTSGLYKPGIDFSSVNDADTTCQTVATGNGLGGTWKAWISSTSSPVVSRIANVSPWYKLDRTTVVFTGYPNGLNFNQVPLNKDELGNTISANLNVWTQTTTDGTLASPPSYDCAGWISTSGSNFGNVGNANTVGAGWTQGGNLGCNNASGAHFYCFEQ
ncbi:MAG: hypothetical protein IPM57_03075 [Oligoflexia bacterium]|nr:hypothetical protein [Oligoflexia bacterium]